MKKEVKFMENSILSVIYQTTNDIASGKYRKLSPYYYMPPELAVAIEMAVANEVIKTIHELKAKTF
jgi:hypothetical protein